MYLQIFIELKKTNTVDKSSSRRIQVQNYTALKLRMIELKESVGKKKKVLTR